MENPAIVCIIAIACTFLGAAAYHVGANINRWIADWQMRRLMKRLGVRALSPLHRIRF